MVLNLPFTKRTLGPKTNFSTQGQKRGHAPQRTPGVIKAKVGKPWCTGGNQYEHVRNIPAT